MNWREDKTLLVLCVGIVFFTVMVCLVVYTKADDVQLYTLFAGVFGQFTGALMMHLRGEKATPPGTTTATTTATITETPQEPKA